MVIRVPGSTTLGQISPLQNTVSTPASAPSPVSEPSSEHRMLKASRRIRGERTGNASNGVPEDRPIRHELVRQIRAQIEAGEYDSAAKIEVAADRLTGVLNLLA